MKIKILIPFFLFPLLCYSQADTVIKGLALQLGEMRVKAIVYEGDTIPFVTLQPIVCYTDRIFTSRKQKAAWDRLKYNVKIVYPYAILAAAKLKEYDRILAAMPEKDRKIYTKLAEKQLKDQFGKELENLTTTQGRLLVKLVDRETGKTTYTIVKEMRGSFSAFMWQSLALMFSSNLKDEYDAQGEDKNIEQAIRLIEDGAF
jgi:Domain of unknown function (DUF4294)